jgi:hypothetical protein
MDYLAYGCPPGAPRIRLGRFDTAALADAACRTYAAQTGYVTEMEGPDVTRYYPTIGPSAPWEPDRDYHRVGPERKPATPRRGLEPSPIRQDQPPPSVALGGA